MSDVISRTLVALDGPRRPWALIAVLLPILLLLVPPNGVLDDNEEHYFAIARHSVAAEEPAPASAVMEGMPHTYLFAQGMGTLIGTLGYERAQVVGRTVVALLYALALGSFAAALGLGALGASAAVLAFWLTGQDLFGGEFMISGAEPKTFAYPVILFALTAFVKERYLLCFGLCAAASYLHFLVGAQCMAVMFIALLLLRAPVKRVLTALAVFAAATLPLIAYLVVTGYGAIASDALEGPATGMSASQIMSHVRAPHHSSPFLALTTFREWLPGICMLLAIGGLSLATMRRESGLPRLLATLVVVAAAALVLALAITAFDDRGVLGPLTPFRLTSMLLLLALFLALIMIGRLAGSGAQPLRIGAAVLIAAAALPIAAVDAVNPVREQRRRLDEQAALHDFVRSVPAGDALFVIEPSLERPLLSFERRTGRTLLVLHKFVPATNAGVLEWYRRRNFQQALFADGCAQMTYPVTHIVVAAPAAPELARSCGEVAFKDGRYAVVTVSDTKTVAP
jgi:hypothetical protein